MSDVRTGLGELAPVDLLKIRYMTVGVTGKDQLETVIGVIVHSNESGLSFLNSHDQSRCIVVPMHRIVDIMYFTGVTDE